MREILFTGSLASAIQGIILAYPDAKIETVTKTQGAWRIVFNV